MKRIDRANLKFTVTYFLFQIYVAITFIAFAIYATLGFNFNNLRFAKFNVIFFSKNVYELQY